MKKISTTLILIMSFMLTFGQMLPANYPSRTELNSKSVGKYKNLHQTTSKGTSRWINYGNAIENYLGSEFTLSANNLFPDSTIKVMYSDGFGGPWIHLIADVVDINSFFWDDAANESGELLLNPNSTYTIDSVQMICMYSHNLDASIVDTLEVEFAVNFQDSAVAYYFAGTTAQNFNSDTVRFIGLDYNMNSNNLAASMFPNKVTLKVPLTKAMSVDTLDNGLNVIQFKTPVSLPQSAFKLFVASYKFIPGYTYSWSDTLASKNSLRFISMEEVENGYLTSYNKGDYNCSYILPQDVRYETDPTSSWNKNFIPSFAYTAPFSYEHHYIYYLISGVSEFGYVNINDLSKNINVNVYPNPSTSKLTIDLNSNELSTISIYNLVGQNVKQISTSNNSIELNVNDLISGTYLLKVIQGTKTFTGKIIVQ